MNFLKDRYLSWRMNRALVNQDKDKVIELVHKRKDSDVLNVTIDELSGHCSLTLAVQKRCLSKVKFVLSVGTDPNRAVNTYSGLSALHYIAQYNHFDDRAKLIFAELLNGKDGKIDFDIEAVQPLSDGAYISQTPLMTAIINENVGFVTELLKNGAKVNYIDPMIGVTPLLLASGQANVQLIRILIDAGANVKQCSAGQFTALHWFASNNQDECECVEVLIENGLPVDQATLGQMVTPLMMAASNGLYNSVVVLLRNGADPTAQDTYGRNAITYARQFEDYEIVDAIIREMTKSR